MLQNDSVAQLNFLNEVFFMVFTVDLADIDFSYSLWAVNFYHTVLCDVDFQG
jgi:hypothetical protein